MVAMHLTLQEGPPNCILQTELDVTYTAMEQVPFRVNQAEHLVDSKPDSQSCRIQTSIKREVETTFKNSTSYRQKE